MGPVPLKYIRIMHDGEYKLHIFPRALIHSDVAGGRKVYSAGFVHPGRNICFGRSETLDIGATPDIDNRLLNDGKILSPEVI